MHRRDFVTSAVALATIAGSTTHVTAHAASLPPATKGYVVRNGHNRFGEHTPLIGQSRVDIKVSGQDTAGAMTIGEYTGHTKGDPRSTSILTGGSVRHPGG